MTSQELVQQQREVVAFIDEPRLRSELAEVLPATVTEAQFVRAFKNAVIADPTGNLIKADRVSLYQAVLRCAMEGLLPDGRDAVILPFYDNKAKQHKAQFIPMIAGQRRIAGEYGWALVASVVYANDQFDPDLENHRANHKPTRLGEERGEIIGAYAIAEHRDGRKIGPVVMNLDDIKRVRAKSKQPDGQLWKDWFDRACEKTVAKQVMKQIPWDTKDRERIDLLLSDDDTNGEQDIARLYGDRPDSPPVRAVQAGEAESRTPASPPPNVDPQTGEVFEPIPDEADDGLGEPLDGEQPFDGDEPPEETPVVEGEIVTGEAPTFTAGRHEGLTVQEVYELGEEGVRYLRWSLKNWRTDPLATALAAFAEEHPEIR